MDDRRNSIGIMDTALRNMRCVLNNKGEIARSNLHLQNFLREYCDIYSVLQEYIKKTDVLRELARVLIYWETM